MSIPILVLQNTLRLEPAIIGIVWYYRSIRQNRFNYDFVNFNIDSGINFVEGHCVCARHRPNIILWERTMGQACAVFLRIEIIKMLVRERERGGDEMAVSDVVSRYRRGARPLVKAHEAIRNTIHPKKDNAPEWRRHERFYQSVPRKPPAEWITDVCK